MLHQHLIVTDKEKVRKYVDDVRPLVLFMLHPIRETAHFTKWTYLCPFRELASSLAHFKKWARITLTLAHFMNWTLT
jgi:hypothetical protein